MAVLRLLKSEVERIPSGPVGKSIYYYDPDLKGFALRVSGTTKTYFVQGYIGSRKVRVTLGRHGVLTAEEARKKAKVALGEIADDINPVAREKQDDKLSMTLAEWYEEYKKDRAADGGLRPKTLSVYQSALDRYFADWLKKPATEITREMVLDRYRKIASTVGKRSKETGAKAQAAQAMRVLRSLLNFAAKETEDDQGKSPFPTNQLSKLPKGWSRVQPREEVIDPHELKDWYVAVDNLNNPVIKDFLLFCLFTGLRRSAAAKLTWDDVNDRAKTITIPDTVDKMGKKQRLPMSDLVEALLARRAALLRLGNKYVFPGEKQGEHLQEPKTAIAKVVSKSGVKFSCHTLRRTFATVAERLDISYYKVKKLLNHAVSNDVTGTHYVKVDVEQLREPMQQIANYLKMQMGLSVDESKPAGLVSARAVK
jgi:integrase